MIAVHIDGHGWLSVGADGIIYETCGGHVSGQCRCESHPHIWPVGPARSADRMMIARAYLDGAPVFASDSEVSAWDIAAALVPHPSRAVRYAATA